MKLLRNMPVAGKAVSVVLVLVVLQVLTAVIGGWSLHRTRADLRTVVDVHAEKVRLAARIHRGLTEMHRAEKNMLLSTTPAEFEEAAASLSEYRTDVEERLAVLISLADEEGLVLKARFNAAYQEFLKSVFHVEADLRKSIDETAGKGAESFPLLAASRMEGIDLSRGKGRAAYEQASAAMRAIVVKNDHDMKLIRRASAERAATASRILIVCSVVFVLLGLILGITSGRAIAANLHKLIGAADAIGHGNFDTVIETEGRDELGKLAAAIAGMRDSLQRANEQEKAQDWLKTGLLRLEQKLRGLTEVNDMAQRAIAELAGYLQAPVGAFYVVIQGNETKLVPAAGYACEKTVALQREFRLDEGLPGQAAQEKTLMLVREIPDDYIKVSSALGEAIPKLLVVLPLLRDETVKGVVEVGLLSDLTDVQQQYLDQAGSRLAVAIDTLQNREAVAKALEESQALTEELQSQQEELEAANEELEEQTQQLEQSEGDLKAQAGALEAANQYKSEFLANMSHDLRSPLNSLLVLAQTLAENREKNLTDDQLESVGVIRDSGRDLLGLIDDILDLSKIEAGRMELHPEAIEVVDLADSIKSRFLPLAEEKGLNLVVAVGENAPPVLHSDRKRVEQVLRNLLSNALKFTTEGSVTVRFGQLSWVNGHWEDSDGKVITLSTRTALPTKHNRKSQIANRQFLSIAVSDTGDGIPPDKLTTIFEAFERVGPATGGARGTGLGLSIATELADLLGGEIQVASALGQGSTFTFYLPIETEYSVRKPERARPGDKPRVRVRARIQGKAAPFISDDRDNLPEDDKTILVIEDDERFAQILLNQCHERGFKCVATASGEEGLRLATEIAPQAVLLDLHLPGMDGWAVLDRLKGDMTTRHIPVHVISAEDDPVAALRRGAVGHLAKPANLEDLAEAFRKIEGVISRQLRRLLILSGSQEVRRGLAELLDNGVVQAQSRPLDEGASDALKTGEYDCAIVDLGLPGERALSLLRELSKTERVARTPIIAYSEKPLTREQARLLRECVQSTVIKGPKSEDRLLDEVSLFLHRVVADLPAAQRGRIAGLYQSEDALKGRKVLIVDDDMRNTFALAKALADKGAETLKAENGQKALEVLQQEADVDLVLMDLMMPVMDGYEAMKRIRGGERFRGLPIIALTAKAMKKDREEAMAAGASDYLPKPVDLNRLFSMIRMWVYR